VNSRMTSRSLRRSKSSSMRACSVALGGEAVKRVAADKGAGTVWAAPSSTPTSESLVIAPAYSLRM
jgi:hypothetical protein